MAWSHQADKRYRRNGVQPVGQGPDWDRTRLHRAHQPSGEAGVGSEGQGRGLDRPDMVVRQGDRVFVRGYANEGFGEAIGPVTLDNDSLWLVKFSWYTLTFEYRDLVKAFDA